MRTCWQIDIRTTNFVRVTLWLKINKSLEKTTPYVNIIYTVSHQHFTTNFTYSWLFILWQLIVVKICIWQKGIFLLSAFPAIVHNSSWKHKIQNNKSVLIVKTKSYFASISNISLNINYWKSLTATLLSFY